jgi:hypothetical protein
MRVKIYSGTWHGIPLTEIAQEAGVSLKSIAASDVYRVLYERWAANGFPAEPGWREAKAPVANLVEQSLKKAMPALSGPILSTGVGLCYIEEILMERGYSFELHECQDHSFDRLRGTLGPKMPPTFVSPAIDAIPGQGRYSAVLGLGLTYVFDDAQYLTFLKESHRLLKPGGVLLHACHDIPFVPLYKTKRVVKQLIGRHEIPWGYLRSPSNHLEMARRAGGFEPVEVSTWGLDHQPNTVRRVFGMPIPGQPAHGVTFVLRKC